ncbi:MAG: HAD family hydrolase [Candidatus Magasanikbacteria bacterium]|nr:HAD family hydrolase [Candidatus Magasanikbacteria bacterium]
MSFSSYTTKSIAAILAELKSSQTGLPPSEASARLAASGPNQIVGEEFRWWQILFRQFNTPFIFLLLGAAALSFILHEFTDGIIVVIFIVINSALGFTQEYHSQKSLELLKKYVVAEARVRRGGKEILVPAITLVPGDIIIVEAGDIMPADSRFFECTDLVINESVLTGESVAVEKIASDLTTPAEQNHQAKNIGFSGTTLVSGKGIGIVIATGRQTVLGDITRLTVETHHQSSFEKGIGKFSKFILRMILVILAFLFILNLVIKGSHTNIFELALFSIALAVSVVPEALPVVTTIALSKGAIKLAKHHVVVKRLSAVEDLGSIEILCTDKTGTLTENKLTVAEVMAPNKARCIFLAALASPFLGDQVRAPNNAFDIALWDKLGEEDKKQFAKYSKISEIPFDPVRRRNSVLVGSNPPSRGVATGGVSPLRGHPSSLDQSATQRSPTPTTPLEGGLLIVRGAPEVLFELCRLKKNDQTEIETWMAAQGKLGRRVIALGIKSEQTSRHNVSDEIGLTWIGIISFVDPIKPTAHQALTKARKLGLQIKILTGDSKEVAAAVGLQVGLITNSEEVATGEDLEKMHDVDAQVALAEKVAVFARVSPEQKYHIIQLLQTKHEVGFLGEGINDAPALKMADVGIVVSDASDIARDAADIVLLKKSLNVIVDGIHEGREIFANTVKYIKTTLISNFGNFFAIAVASLIIPYLPMLPVQILLLNLLSDFPMIAIAADKVDPSELKRPRAYNVREIVLVALVFGAVSTIFDFIFFAIFKPFGSGALQTNWFIGSVLTELVLIFSVRTNRFFLSGRRPATVLSVLSVAAFIGAISLPFIPFTRRIFNFIRPDASHITLLLSIVALYFVVNEVLKLFYYRRTRLASN